MGRMSFYDHMGKAYVDTQNVNKNLFNLISALPEEIERALQEEAKLVLEIAQSPSLIPIKSGDMMRSGEVSRTEVQGRETSIAISFGGSEPSSRYTYIQHEDQTINHPNGGGAKFLEKALQAAYPGQLQRIGNRIRKNRITG